MRYGLFLCAWLACTALAVADTEYEEVDYDVFRVAPESYKSKRLTYTVAFRRLSSTLAPYMEQSGYRSDRYLWLLTGDQLIPVLIKKNDDVVELVASFKPGDRIRVSGKVRRFSRKPKQTVLSQYYVLADEVKVEVPALKKPPDPRKPVRPPKRFRPWRRKP